MGISAFCRKQVLMLEGIEYTMSREVQAGLWQLEAVKTGRIREIKTDDLLRFYADGHAIFVRAISEATGKNGAFQSTVRKSQAAITVNSVKEEAAKVKRMYVIAILDYPVNPALITQAIDVVWTKHQQPKRPPHWTTVVRWRKRYIASGKDIASLNAHTHEQGNRKRRFDLRTLEIVEQAIEDIYLARERGSIQDTLDRAIAVIAKANRLELESNQITLATRRLVTRVIHDIPAFDRYAARYGLEAARRKFRTVIHQVAADRPLKRGEIDHARMNIFIVDDETDLPLGRPWITVLIDDYTRCILGIYIGFEPPSHYTVARCLKHAFLPKVSMSAEYPDVKGTWDAFGTIETLVVDNGLEFHAQNLERACYPFGVSIQYCPRKTPWYKGKIERFFRTLNAGVAHGFPGTTFSNIFEKDDYDAIKNAVVSLKTFQTMVRKWIVDYYHEKPHRTLNAAPIEVWRANIKLEDIFVPDDPLKLDAVLGKTQECTLTHKGVVVDHLYYNSPELGDLRRQFGDKLKVKVSINDGDLGQAIVIGPDDKTLVKTRAVAFEYANGMTRWQHNLCKKYARQNRIDESKIIALAEAKEAIRELVERDTGIRKRVLKRGGKAKLADPKSTSTNSAASLSGAPAVVANPKMPTTEHAAVDVPITPQSDLGVVPLAISAVIKNRPNEPPFNV